MWIGQAGHCLLHQTDQTLGGTTRLIAHPAVMHATSLALDLEARGVARKAGHAVLIIIIVLIVLGILIGAGLTTLLRRRR